MNRSMLFLFLALSTQLYGQWRPTTPLGNDINDITFTDDSIGYAVSETGNVGSCLYDYSIHKTIDGGDNWVRLKAGISDKLEAIHFTNSLVGWVAAEYSQVLKTTDGGMSWVEQTSGVGSGYNDIWFIDLNIGFVIGNNGLLRRSTDGGTSWNTISSGVDSNLEQIFFVDSQVGFIACSDGTLLKSTNAGISWTSQNFGASTLRDVAFTSTSTGYAIGNEDGGTYVWETADGGNSWTATTLSISPRRIVFPNAATGYILSLDEGILKTSDGGGTWNLQYPTDDHAQITLSIHFINENVGYVSGELGTIERTTNGGETWQNVHSYFKSDPITVSVPDKDTAYIGDTGGNVYKTTNGGVTYSHCASTGFGAIKELRFLNHHTGFAASEGGAISKTTDGGKNWSANATDTAVTFTDLSFVAEQTGYASASGGLIFKTENSGTTWDSVQTGYPSSNFTSIWFINADTGFVTESGYDAHIYRTLDGGVSWSSYYTGPNGIIDDIVFTNDSLGYCVKSEILKTENTGETWEVQSNSSFPLTINELFMYNDSSGFSTYGDGQSTTLDSCQSFSTGYEQCAVGGFQMEGIAGTTGGNYAYVVGEGRKLTQLDPTEITKVQVAGNTHCPGNTIFVSFFGRGYWGQSNTFTAQLSDAGGSFDSPVTIGTYPSTPNIYGSGVITATIPPGTPNGNYRVRVVASDPELEGPDNGYDILIQNTITPTVAIAPNLADQNCQGTLTGLMAEVTGGGLSPQFQWTVNGNPIEIDQYQYLTDTLEEGDQVQVTVNSSLSCANPASLTSGIYNVGANQAIETGLSSDTAICDNSQITLEVNSGYTYNWTPETGLDDATAANPTATITDDITYHVLVTNEEGCTAEDSISITALPQPIVFTEDTMVCSGTEIQLEATPGGTYNWSPATGLNDPVVANPVAIVTENVNYLLTATAANGCTSTDSVNIAVYPEPSISLWADTTVCEADCIQFTPSLNTGLQSVEWSPGGALNDSLIVDPIFCATGSQSFTLAITDVNGCQASTTTQVNVNSLPEVPTVSFDGSSLTSSPASGYQWYLAGDPIDGATSMLYTPLQNGLYSVAVTNAEGCSNTSDDYLLEGLGMERARTSAIEVYPNPTDGLVIIEQGDCTIKNIEVTDIRGKGLLHFNGYSEQIDFSFLASGTYILRINTGRGTVVKRVNLER